jgi:uncharacterized membrane protein YdjX (TVP38/TMEM64 family)
MRSEPPASDGGAPPEIPWAGIAVTVAGVLTLGLAVLIIDPLRQAVEYALSGDTDALRDELNRGAGIAILYGLLLAHTFVWYPAEIVDAAAGFVFGFWGALGLVMAGWIVQGMLAYWIGRTAARPVLHRFIGRERFERAERVINGGGATLLLAARLVPIVPFSLFSYVAGAAHVPVLRFLWTTAIGYIPITAIFIYYGSRLDALSLEDPIVWAGAVLLVLLLLLMRKLRPLLSGAASAPADRPTDATP